MQDPLKSSLLQSRRFWVMVISLVVSLLVVVFPGLQEYREELISGVIIVASVLIGGFSLEDAMIGRERAKAAGTPHEDLKALIQQALLELFGPQPASVQPPLYVPKDTTSDVTVINNPNISPPDSPSIP